MRQVWAYFLTLALSANLLVAGGPFATTAHACSCAGFSSTEEAFRTSDAVFFGEAVEVGKLPSRPAGGTTFAMPYLAPVTFEVQGSWKGVSGASAVVRGQGPEASCGINFERGETYLVFAYRAGSEGPLQTDLCGATSAASGEIARNLLGPPQNTSPETLPETGGSPYVAAIAFGCVSLAAGVLFSGRVLRGFRS